MLLLALSLCGNAFNTEVKIGYDTNYFVPLNPKVDSTDWVKKYAAFNESLLIKGDSIDGEKVVNNKAKDDEDEYFGTKPWWADYGVESSLENDELNYLYPDDDDDSDELDIEYYKEHSNDLKQIYYYEDINDKWGRLSYSSIKEFNDFCAEAGIYMTNETANNLLYNFETHCCLDPLEKEKGNLILVDDTSYGGLTWTVGIDEEEYEEIYNKSKKHIKM